MHEPETFPEHRKRRAKTLAMATLAGATVVALTLPSVAQADPEPPPPPPPGNTFLEGPAADPNAPPPAGQAPPADPNAPVAGPNAPAAEPNPAPPAPPEPGRVNNNAGGFSYVVPAGWKVADATQLSYGQALLTKAESQAATPQQPGAQPANDTSVLLGRLDMKLFAGAEADNGKAAIRLASDMGEFFMPFPGTRINQENGPLTAGDMPGAFSAYDVKFTDTNKPNGQIWAGVVGNATPTVAPGQPLTPRGQRNERWFVVWLGSANNPIDKTAAATLASSIRPWTPPPAPEPDPNAPPAPNVNAGPNAPQQRPEVGVAVPVNPENAPPGMAPPAG
jgi:hypothetical protein